MEYRHQPRRRREMTVTFSTCEPVEATMIFEEVYEPELQFDKAEKAELIDYDCAVWMYVDGVLVGECLGVPCDLLDVHDPDYLTDARCIYCFGTTLLPRFQGRGLAKLLVAYWNGYVKGLGFSTVYGHATSPAMLRVRKFFGAQVDDIIGHWYETERTAYHYEQPL
jgi:GNAT superfamily N-acetyltransferase